MNQFRSFSSAAFIALLCGAAAPAQQTHTTWSDYFGGSDSSHYSALKQINSGNVAKLEVAWTYPNADDVTYTFNPIVIDNIAYFAAKQGELVAVDATSGKEIWSHSFAVAGAAPSRFSGITGQRGANFWQSPDGKDKRILVTANGFLQAIDAKTGNLVDSFADHGKLDLKIGIDRATRPLASRTPGRVTGNTLILGSATGEGYLAPPGDIRAFDVVTGKLLWVFHTIPRPGEYGYESWPKDAYKYMGGVDVWGEITVDEKRGIAYFPVASAKYELYGGDRPGNNLYADCLLALDIKTGKHLWHFQTVHHDVWDYDPDAAPQLATVKHDGKMVDAVALASKNGYLFVFDRVTGKPLWPIEERPFPQSDNHGEKTSPTQPIPTVVPPFTRHDFSLADLYTGFMKPDEVVWWKDRLSKAQTGLYMPPSLTKDTVNMPSVNGGALFFSTAANPTDGTVYVVGKNMASIVKLVPQGQSTQANAGNLIPSRPPRVAARAQARTGIPTPEQMGRGVYETNCLFCHGPELKGDRGPALDTVISRLGEDTTRKTIHDGRNTMPSFSALDATSTNNLIAFLKAPDLAPPGTAPTAATQAMMRTLTSEPPYPEDVEGPPSRYKTGYGNEAYVFTPPWTLLTAYDLNTGKIKWQTPYGGIPQAPTADQMKGNAYPKSGIVVTAGGVILFAGNDSKLYAVDSTNGKIIATKDLPNGSQGVPAVYEVGGREYVLISASGGGTPYPEGAYVPPTGNSVPTPTKKAYVAFALPTIEKK